MRERGSRHQGALLPADTTVECAKVASAISQAISKIRWKTTGYEGKHLDYWASSVRVYVPVPTTEVTTTSTAMSCACTTKGTTQTSGTTLLPQSTINWPVSASKS